MEAGRFIKFNTFELMNDVHKVKLSFQCPQSWKKMQHVSGGRFCSDCKKVVHDFSHRKNISVSALINKKNESKLCGNFKSTQLHQPFGDHRDSRIAFHQSFLKKERGLKKSLVLLISFLSLVVTGCYKTIRGEVSVENVKVPDSLTTKVEKDSVKTK